LILPGVRIGSKTVIGAGSVVTRDIPDEVFAAGNPCRVIRAISPEDGEQGRRA
jgi:maltose O-acetyltransferase